MAKKFDVALIGAGRMGQIHGPQRRAPSRVCASRYVVDTDAKAGRARCAADLGARVSDARARCWPIRAIAA